MHESENPISQSDNPSINQSFKQPLLLMAGPLENLHGPRTVAAAVALPVTASQRTPPHRRKRRIVALPVTASQRTRGRSTRTARCGRMTRSLALAVTGNWEKST